MKERRRTERRRRRRVLYQFDLGRGQEKGKEITSSSELPPRYWGSPIPPLLGATAIENQLHGFIRGRGLSAGDVEEGAVSSPFCVPGDKSVSVGRGDRRRLKPIRGKTGRWGRRCLRSDSAVTKVQGEKQRLLNFYLGS